MNETYLAIFLLLLFGACLSYIFVGYVIFPIINLIKQSARIKE